MVHELLTINNNQVDLSHIEDIKPDLQKLLLCAEQDDLYRQVNCQMFNTCKLFY